MRGSITPRGKSTWRIRYDGPRDASGQRRQVSETVKGTKRDAERVLRDRLAAIEQNTFVAPSRLLVSEFLEQWLNTYAIPNTSPLTVIGYRTHFNRINRWLGSMPLQRLSPYHIQSMYAEMATEFKPRTVMVTHTLLHEALKYAVRWGLLSRNPVEATEPPRRGKDTEPVMWSVQDILRFLEAANGHRYYHVYHLAILTGMRRGELAGLQWEQVDLERKLLTVTGQLLYIRRRGLNRSLPKTDRGRRISLSQSAVDLLKQVRRRQLEQKLAAGPAWKETGYVFTSETGLPINPGTMTAAFTALVRKLGLPRITLHGLRHAHATLLLSNGVHPQVVSERLGHSSVKLTLDLYSHVLPHIQEAAAKVIDEALSQGSVLAAQAQNT